MKRTPAPFRVYKGGEGWFLQQRGLPFRVVAGFATPGDAIDYAYRNWPWWP